MDAGQAVYRGEVYLTGSLDGGNSEARYYISTAVATGIVVDGVEMVRMHDLLLPADRFVLNRREAKRQIIDSLVRFAGVLASQIDRLRDEVLHEDLTTEAAA